MPGQWSESRDRAWSSYTKSELYTGGISRPSLRFNDGLLCLMLMASLTQRSIFESLDVKILVLSGLISCPLFVQCSYMTELHSKLYSSCLI